MDQSLTDAYPLKTYFVAEFRKTVSSFFATVWNATSCKYETAILAKDVLVALVAIADGDPTYGLRPPAAAFLHAAVNGNCCLIVASTGAHPLSAADWRLNDINHANAAPPRRHTVNLNKVPTHSQSAAKGNRFSYFNGCLNERGSKTFRSHRNGHNPRTVGCGQVIENCFAIKCGGCGKWGHGKYVGLKRSLAPQLDAHSWQWNCNTCLPIVKADIFMKDGNLQSAVDAVLATNNATRCKEIIQMYRRDAGGNTQH
ncbi:hypothetical protein DAPPUDRAFT_108126 [Daphnia pulex]|uniref:Uncharacterized protein n=1 Tax=Daphnia pulex TaxID=6669 RepID=E9GZ85_DAPPU|nr:hypothetical protein DAPPUDRAFT_119143 [Daphnia pulex]EFX75200.1 hypothetical protein DAPPUDRAFT_108126 [Daphnia pulex]|eukprot:EFX63518.1 hypothetical protein DAPPUDRAFT_119143 [Daphnia pulex]